MKGSGMNIPEEAKLTDKEIEKIWYGFSHDYGSLTRIDLDKLFDAQFLKAIPVIEKQVRREIGEWLSTRLVTVRGADNKVVERISGLSEKEIEALKQGELPRREQEGKG